MFFVATLLLLAYGLLCLVAPEKHLAVNARWNRWRRKKWHEHRDYTPLYLRVERRWSQRTPANLWGLRLTGIGFIGGALWVIWEYWILHH